MCPRLRQPPGQLAVGNVPFLRGFVAFWVAISGVDNTVFKKKELNIFLGVPLAQTHPIWN